MAKKKLHTFTSVLKLKVQSGVAMVIYPTRVTQVLYQTLENMFSSTFYPLQATC
jgi:hypothetical protein